MNRRMVFYLIGQILLIGGGLLMLPLLVCLIYREHHVLAFFASALISAGAGLILMLFAKPKTKAIYAKEGFVIVAVSWIVLSVIGALPFTFSGTIPSFVDAFFETVSGFTTTGATILPQVEGLGRGILFWRSFTHWIGGMGVIVFMTAIIPTAGDKNVYILRAEMPGPTMGRLVPRLRDTSRILYLIYILISVLMVLLLLSGGMDLYESVVHMFGTAGTGGFGVRNDSIAGYSPYLKWVITLFMLVFGVNFNLYYLILRKQLRLALKSTELQVYLGIWAISTFFIVVNLMTQGDTDFAHALQDGAFQTSSIMTTTGFSTVDFNHWPVFSKGILVALMFIGACAGSTGGGFKISRVIMLYKDVRREIRHLLHPRAVGVVKFEGKKVENQTLRSVNAYFALYVALAAVIFLLLCLDKYDLQTNFTAMAACLNNIGPGLGAVGPVGNYSGYSAFSKLLLSAAMLLGRLEIYPILIALTPQFWKR